MAGAPRITLALGGGRRWTLAAPAELGGRDWLLGVAAVQAFVDQGDYVPSSGRARRASPGARVTARLRIHQTGAGEATIVELADGDVLAFALHAPDEDPGSALETARATAAARPARPGLALSIADAPAGLVEVADDTPDGARAFGHVFCRWTRAGDHEAGVDLTPFVAPELGVKHLRVCSRDLVAPARGSYAIALR